MEQWPHWFGLTTGTNPLESDNWHGLRKTLTEELKGSSPEQVSFIAIIRLLWAKILPKWSRECTHDDLKDEIKLLPRDIRGAKAYANAPNLRKLGDHLYCSRQKSEGGELHKLEKKDAKRAIALWSSKKAWTYSDFGLLATVVFTTTQACFPCNSWATKLWCYHMLAIRLLVDGNLGIQSEGDKLQEIRKRGPTAKKRNQEYLVIA